MSSPSSLEQRLIDALKREHDRTERVRLFVEKMHEQDTDPEEVARHIAYLKGRQDVQTVLLFEVARENGAPVGPGMARRLAELEGIFSQLGDGLDIT
jgi:hypothetical protein